MKRVNKHLWLCGEHLGSQTTDLTKCTAHFYFSLCADRWTHRWRAFTACQCRMIKSSTIALQQAEIADLNELSPVGLKLTVSIAIWKGPLNRFAAVVRRTAHRYRGHYRCHCIMGPLQPQYAIIIVVESSGGQSGTFKAAKSFNSNGRFALPSYAK